MNVNTSNLVSITEANQNFSRVARMVDEGGPVVILKNNAPGIFSSSSAPPRRSRRPGTRTFSPSQNA